MYPDYCERCNSKHFFIKENKNQTGVYCSRCGKWQKWLSKEERRIYEHNAEEKVETESCDSKDMITRLKEFVEYLDKAIDSEYEKTPLSVEDSIRKNSYCLALERTKNSIHNILNGKDFNYMDD